MTHLLPCCSQFNLMAQMSRAAPALEGLTLQLSWPLTSEDTAPLRELLLAGGAPKLRVVFIEVNENCDVEASGEDLQALADLVLARPTGVRFASPALDREQSQQLAQLFPGAQQLVHHDCCTASDILRNVDRDMFCADNAQHSGACPSQMI